MSKTIVCYHADCTDGLVAAWAVRKVMTAVGREAVYVPIAYTVPETIPTFDPGDQIVAVDFSWSGETLKNAFTEASKVTVLDHHKGAIDKIEAYFDRHLLPDNIELVLDTSMSGAGLAWNYYNHGAVMPDLVKHAQDYDLWQFKYEGTRAYIKAVMTKYLTFEGLDFVSSTASAKFYEEGQLFLEQEAQLIKYHVVHDRVDVRFAGYDVPLVNVPRYLTSAVGEYLLKTSDAPFVLMYRDIGLNRNWSLRSLKGGVDVSLIAQQFNGNGHPTAAGFVTSIFDPLVVDYLEKE